MPVLSPMPARRRRLAEGFGFSVRRVGASGEAVVLDLLASSCSRRGASAACATFGWSRQPVLAYTGRGRVRRGVGGPVRSFGRRGRRSWPVASAAPSGGTGPAERVATGWPSLAASPPRVMSISCCVQYELGGARLLERARVDAAALSRRVEPLGPLAHIDVVQVEATASSSHLMRSPLWIVTFSGSSKSEATSTLTIRCLGFVFVAAGAATACPASERCRPAGRRAIGLSPHDLDGRLHLAGGSRRYSV